MFIPLIHQVQCPKCQRIGEIQLQEPEKFDIHCQCKKCKTSFYIPSPFNHQQSQDSKNEEELDKTLEKMLEKWKDRMPERIYKSKEAHAHPPYEF